MSGQPNIIVILADDMGYGDVACYDPEHNRVPTPNLDALAQQGRRFTNCHTTSSLCTPSRYSLLTGRYAWRTRLQQGVMMPYDEPLIAEDRLTLPSMLRQQGYTTSCVGKWHLGIDWPKQEGEVVFDEPLRGGPIDRGFDRYFGVDVPNFPPYAWIEQDRILGPVDSRYEKDEEMHLGIAGPGVAGWEFDQILPELTKHALSEIEAAAQQGSPLFLYFSLTTPHEPIAPSPQFKGKSGISGVADLMMETDWAVGEIMAVLEREGMAENTLLIFTTDNGHCPYTGLEPFERVGHRVSGPLRGYKGDVWEGGHRVPFLARWPQVIPAGTECMELLSLADLMATCAAISGASIPEESAEDSFNALPLFRAEGESERPSAVIHSAFGKFGLLKDHWKLSLCPHSGGPWNPEPEPDSLPFYQLHDLRVDIGERHNLAQDQPEVVENLISELEQMVKEGRSTPGSSLKNDVEPVNWRTGS